MAKVKAGFHRAVFAGYSTADCNTKDGKTFVMFNAIFKVDGADDIKARVGLERARSYFQAAGVKTSESIGLPCEIKAVERTFIKDGKSYTTTEVAYWAFIIDGEPKYPERAKKKSPELDF